MSTPQRNERCPCGSGKKYKQCCLHKQRQANQTNQANQANIVPLRIRQIVPVSSSTSPLLPAALSIPSQAASATSATSATSVSETSSQEENVATPALQNPTNPSYDSLMERVFGPACTETKTHLQAKEKDASATLEETDEQVNEEEAENEPTS